MSGSINGFVYVTSHAIKRFGERFSYGTPTRADVLRVVIALARNAVPWGGQRGVDRYWLARLKGDPGRDVVLVTAPNRERRGVIVKTVLTREQAIQNMQDEGLGLNLDVIV